MIFSLFDLLKTYQKHYYLYGFKNLTHFRLAHWKTTFES